MQQPANFTLYGDRRLAFNDTVAFFGFDLTGAAVRMDVRTAPDASGAALLTLSTGTGEITIAYAGTDTVANHIAAGRISREDLPNEGGYSELADGDNLALTLIDLHIDAADMVLAAVPAFENGDSVELAFDILITPTAGEEEKYAYGPFAVRGTVTQ